MPLEDAQDRPRAPAPVEWLQRALAGAPSTVDGTGSVSGQRGWCLTPPKLRLGRPGHAHVTELLKKGLQAEKALDPESASRHYRAAVAANDRSVDALLRLSKAVSDTSLDAAMTMEEARSRVRKGVQLAQRAQRMNPACAQAHVAEAINLGRLAMYSGNREKVRLVRMVREKAECAVELDPREDLAHHAVGRWHHELASVNGILRRLINVVYRESLKPGSYEEALWAYQRAVELRPERLVHHAELGRTLYRMGRRREGADELRQCLALEVEDVNDAITKGYCEAAIAQLDAGKRLTLW
mmetsp:Transcript_16822/g.55022  ORF Transcript_16822/g.55022 Transcript_16822/m.55022 type:complete len:298 (-) Transcript_16822:66-959(-)